jgi:hypothetical protein
MQRPFQVVKPSEVETILFNFHEDPPAGHFGFHETYQSINEKYFLLNMGNGIKAYIQSCDVCQKRAT